MDPLSSNLADAILAVHAIVVLFNVGAFPVIWLGYFRGWKFVRNAYFRIIHMLLIGVVAAESFFGFVCPLTTWEDNLRSNQATGAGTAGRHEQGFIAYWLHELLFYDLPAWVFTVAYILFFALVVFTFCWVRPQLPSLRKHC